MQFSISKEEIIKPLEMLNNVTKSTNSVDKTLNKIFLEVKNDVLTLISKNEEMQLISQISLKGINQEGKCVIDSGKVVNACKNLSQIEIIQFDLENNILHIKSGKFKTSLNIELETYPQPETENFLDSVLIESKEVLQIIDCVKHSMTANDDSRTTFKGVNLRFNNNYLSASATDGSRYAYAKTQVDTHIVEKSLILPKGAVKEIVNLLKSEPNNVELSFDEDNLMLKFTNYTLITKLIIGNFPDISLLLPNLDDYKMQIKITKNNLKDVLNRLAPFLDEKNKAVYFDYLGSEITLKTLNSNREEAKEIIEINQENSFTETKWKVNLKFLQEVLQAINHEEIVFNLVPTLEKHFVITLPENDNYKFILGYMR